MQNAAMLWTGGKDCSLALYEARRNGYDIRCLVTFAPLTPNFHAQNRSQQTNCVGLNVVVKILKAHLGRESKWREFMTGEGLKDSIREYPI
jgi:diphthamide synthase (EF-2-diphthine--ammonia ligase)